MPILLPDARPTIREGEKPFVPALARSRRTHAQRPAVFEPRVAFG